MTAFDSKSQQKAPPTCFICFDVAETDVVTWLEKVLVPDFKRAGIKPILYSEGINPEKNLDTFQELARAADFVTITCTPEIKRKCRIEPIIYFLFKFPLKFF